MFDDNVITHSQFVPTRVQLSKNEDKKLTGLCVAGDSFVQQSVMSDGWSIEEYAFVEFNKSTKQIKLAPANMSLTYVKGAKGDNVVLSKSQQSQCLVVNVDPETQVRLSSQLRTAANPAGLMVRVFVNQASNLVYAHCLPQFRCKLSSMSNYYVASFLYENVAEGTNLYPTPCEGDSVVSVMGKFSNGQVIQFRPFSMLGKWRINWNHISKE
jgi:hypothetical protein